MCNDIQIQIFKEKKTVYRLTTTKKFIKIFFFLFCVSLFFLCCTQKGDYSCFLKKKNYDCFGHSQKKKKVFLFF
jgi:hypothetical protein